MTDTKKISTRPTKTKQASIKTEKLHGAYFVESEKDVDFIPSGCAMLDQVLGGGWAIGRIANIVGDKSSGKSLLGIEACANFVKKFPDPKKHKIFYQEAEAAFDISYAEALGMPVDRIDFVETDNTVEALFEIFDDMMRHPKTKTTKKVGKLKTAEERGFEQALYIIDSLDALSDRAEQLRDIDQGSYGANKAKNLSEMFRRIVKDLASCGITLIVISQIRDKIGVTFGETKTRSGGRALDFYASQVLWLAEIGKRKKTIRGIERPIAINVMARCKKNKVGLPFRDCKYVVEFGYGIDDLTSHLEWLAVVSEPSLSIPALADFDIKKGNLAVSIKKIKKKPLEEYLEITKAVACETVRQWQKIEMEFMPSRSKY